MASTGRGICLYTKEHLNAKELNLDIEAPFQENVLVEISTSTGKMLVGCIYRSPNSDQQNNERLCSLIKRIGEAFSKVTLIGDFNFPKINWTSIENRTPPYGSMEYNFIESMQEAFLTQVVDEPTRFRLGQRANILDLILTSDKDIINNLHIKDPLDNSDHCVITFCICQEHILPNSFQDKFIYDRGDYCKMADLLSVDWVEQLQPLNTEDAWKLFANKLLDAQENCVPKRKINPRMNPPWFGKEQRNKVLEKHQAWRKYMKTNTEGDYKLYTKARNQAKKWCRQGVKRLERDIAHSVKDKPKTFWKYANSKLKSRSGIADLNKQDCSNELTENDKEKAQVLNKFFCEVFTIEDTSEMPNFNGPSIISNLATIQISTDEVAKKLEGLKVDKSKGPDRIHPRILKEMAKIICLPLQIIFNKSLIEGKVPKSWTEGFITPI